MYFRQLIQRNKDLGTVFGAIFEGVMSVRKTFWKHIGESVHRAAVQHHKFMLLDAVKKRGPYYPISLVFRGEHHSIFNHLRVTVRMDSTRLCRIMACLQGPSSCAFRGMRVGGCNTADGP
jgi:hypothetical protein